jgi:HAD superfamily hydrolase (TIGR01549 family)
MDSGKELKAILIDVGGPIIDEASDYEYTLTAIKKILDDLTGKKIPVGEIVEVREKMINSWAPSLTKAIFWQYLKPDFEKYAEAYAIAVEAVYNHHDEVVLVDGVNEIIPALTEEYVLALAGNQPSKVREKLEKTGLLKFFRSNVVSDDIGLHKPDTRFFLEICRRIDVGPENCCMIGDRMDNDIFPANILGMRTILLDTGPHRYQRARVPEDEPDYQIENMREVRAIIRLLNKV